MKKELGWKSYLIIALLIPTLLTIGYAALGGDETLFFAITMFCGYPITIWGMYMWHVGSGFRWVNGIDWSKHDHGTNVRICRYVGKYIMAFGIVFTWAMSTIFASLVLFIIGTILSIILCIIPFIKIGIRGPDGLGDSILDNRRKIMSILAVSILTIVPPAIVLDSDASSTPIEITFNEHYVSVKAPMFNHDFLYEEINEIHLDEDFDRGMRIMGYGTTSICSGKFDNDSFGRYELAAYNSCDACIVISVGGEIFAFNQSSLSKTNTVYMELLSRINPIP